MLPLFKASEDHHGGASAFHGAGGEWRVERQRLSWKLLDAFRAAAAQAGIASIDDFNQGDNEGCDYFEVNQRRGVRWNTAKGFLRPAMDRGNLKVLTGARVARVVFQNRRAVGVRFMAEGGGEQYAQARGEVVLAAGAIGSAQLLQVSGVGPAALLQARGCPCCMTCPAWAQTCRTTCSCA
ncbi:dehydrogenase [Bordetella pertussis]|nr:dehydrogenase [Bordetella pertussis]